MAATAAGSLSAAPTCRRHLSCYFCATIRNRNKETVVPVVYFSHFFDRHMGQNKIKKDL
ncbi:hypothetical protein DSUL_20124 [Desulfovibrionales bacterium]